jgi:hypothetical protein
MWNARYVDLHFAKKKSAIHHYSKNFQDILQHKCKNSFLIWWNLHQYHYNLRSSQGCNTVLVFFICKLFGSVNLGESVKGSDRRKIKNWKLYEIKWSWPNSRYYLNICLLELGFPKLPRKTVEVPIEIWIITSRINFIIATSWVISSVSHRYCWKKINQ